MNTHSETHRLWTLIELLKSERDEARDQIEAMREAIKKAHTALERCKAARGERREVLIITTQALTKLQPFVP